MARFNSLHLAFGLFLSAAFVFANTARAGTGACCAPGVSVTPCSDGVDEATCDASGGVYFAGDVCVSVPCGFAIYVDPNANLTEDGSTWCNAYRKLQDALGVWDNGAVIFVADGIYRPDDGGQQTPGDRSAAFVMLDDMTLAGGYAGCGAVDPDARDRVLHETRLSGDLSVNDATVPCGSDGACAGFGDLCLDGECAILSNNGDNSFHVVSAVGLGGPAVRLDGFTISGGNADAAGFPNDLGGGMRVDSSTVSVNNCIFEYNFGTYGGGVYIVAAGTYSITNSAFRHNTARFGGGLNSFLGSDPPIQGCTFSFNASTEAGGALLFDNSVGDIQNCTFSNNRAFVDGGAVLLFTSDSTFTDCTFDSNVGEDGGAILTVQSAPVVIGCDFLNNQAVGGEVDQGWGGAVLNFEGFPEFRRCTFESNSAIGMGGAIVEQVDQNQGASTIVQCEFRGNRAAFGGALGVRLGAGQTVINSTIIGNIAQGDGGGMNVNSSGDVTVVNTIFYANESRGNTPLGITPFGGGALWAQGGGLVSLINCSMVGNRMLGTDPTDGGGAIIMRNGGAVDIVNSLVWGNTSVNAAHTLEQKQIYDAGGTPGNVITLAYTNVEGWSGSLGDTTNNGLDPDFANQAVGDLRLSSGSPAIDSADNTAAAADTADLDGDENITEKTPVDVFGVPRFIDDPGTVDSGVPGTPGPPVDRGAVEFFAECDDDGIPDACGLSCAAFGGFCADVAGCGTVADCNGNGTPDQCDVDPTDPDGDGFVSEDCDNNQIPDECPPSPVCEPFDGGGGDTNFGNPDNWGSDQVPSEVDNVEIGGGAGPAGGDAGAAGVVTVDLDIDASIGTLRLLNDAILNVTGETVGDLTVVQPEGLFSLGKIFVASDRVVDVSAGIAQIAAQGEYRADPTATLPVGAAMTAQTLVVSRGKCPCPAGTDGGLFELSSDMSLTVTGDIVLKGVEPAGCVCPGASEASRLGINVWPKFSTIGGGVTASGIVIDGSSIVEVNSTGDPLEPAVSLTGDFDNRSTDPTLFDWSSGLLLLHGTSAQSFEVAGLDVGRIPAGFGTPENTNFSMDRIEVASGSDVSFVNNVANTFSSGACAEALYVHELTLRAGATVRFVNANVYYDVLIDEGATIHESGCGELSPFCPLASQPAAHLIADLVVTKNRFLSFASPDVGQTLAARVTFVDLPPAFAAWNGAQLWVDAPREVNEAGGEVPPGTSNSWMSTLQCDGPAYVDFNALGVVHVFHEGIVPGGTYSIELIDALCPVDDPVSFSDPLDLTTPVWGDTVRDLSEVPPLPPGGPPVNVDDAIAVLGRFASSATSITKSRADLEPGCLDLVINVTDVISALSGFSGVGYPFTRTAADPCNTTCADPRP